MNRIEKSILYTVVGTFIIISIGAFLYMHPSILVPIAFTALGIIGMLLIAIAVYFDRHNL